MIVPPAALVRPGAAGPRLVRASALAVVAVALAALAHAGMAGMPIPPLAVLLAVVLNSPIAYAVSARRVTFLASAGSLGLEQTISHLVFAASHGRSSSATAGLEAGPGLSAGAGAGHGEHAGHGTAMAAAMGGLPSGRMLLGHLLATVLLAAALAWGERALWSAARLLPRLPGRPRLNLAVAQVLARGADTAYVLDKGDRRPRVTRGPPVGLLTTLPSAALT